MLNQYKPQMCKCRQLPLDQAEVEGICLEKSCNKPIWCKYCINTNHNFHLSTQCQTYEQIYAELDVQLGKFKATKQLIMLIQDKGNKEIYNKIQSLRVNSRSSNLQVYLNKLQGIENKSQVLIKEVLQLKQEFDKKQYEKVQDRRILLMKFFNLRLGQDAIKERQKQLGEKCTNIQKIKQKLIDLELKKAECLIKKKKFREAEKQLEKLKEQNPKEQKVLILFWEYLLLQNKKDEANQFNKQELKKGNKWIIFATIKCLIKFENYKEASEEAKNAMKNNLYKKNIELNCLTRDIMIKLGQKTDEIDKKIADLKNQERQKKEDNSDSKNRRDQEIYQYRPILKKHRPNP